MSKRKEKSGDAKRLFLRQICNVLHGNEVTKCGNGS